MLIKKIRIENFKIYKDEIFTFDDSKFILVSGSNGFGKTTLIDAIEWCITGKIERIERGFDLRYTTQSEKTRDENNSGIIKNTECSETDEIKVTLFIDLEGKEYVVYRTQVVDRLSCSTQLNILGVEDPAEKSKILKLIQPDNYYNYHVCDLRKSYEFLGSNRKKIKNQFNDFLKSRENVDEFELELNIILQDLDKLNIDITKDLAVKETLEAHQTIISELKAKILNVNYPLEKFYESEITKIEELTSNELTEQLNKVVAYGYKTSFELCTSLIRYNKTKDDLSIAKESRKIYEELKDDIHKSLQNGYWNDNSLDYIADSILKIDNNIKLANNANNANNLKQLDIFTDREELDMLLNMLEKYEIEILTLTNNIKEKEKGNEIMSALTNIVTAKKGVLEYKNEGNNNCPLCGSSDKFALVNNITQLSKEAKIYVENSNSNMLELKQQLISINSIYDSELNKAKVIFISKLKKIQLESTLVLTEFKENYIITKDFFNKLNQLQITIDKNALINLSIFIDENMTKSIPDVLSEKKYNLISNLLLLLSYPLDENGVTEKNIATISVSIKDNFNNIGKTEYCSFDILKNKIVGLTSLLNNSDLNKKTKELEVLISKNVLLNLKLEKNNEYKDNLNQLLKKIRTSKSRLEKLELESVGPYLYKIFTKIVKHSLIKEFKFNRDNSKTDAGITIFDQDDNNILNTLSQGQLGVLMISYFIANIFKRKGDSFFGSYFVDDITSSMDDMNILSLVDIIKYELSNNNSNIKQFFFATCNSDLEGLFIHKMNSFNVSTTKIDFESYAKGNIYIKNNKPIPFGKI